MNRGVKKCQILHASLGTNHFVPWQKKIRKMGRALCWGPLSPKPCSCPPHGPTGRFFNLGLRNPVSRWFSFFIFSSCLWAYLPSYIPQSSWLDQKKFSGVPYEFFNEEKIFSFWYFYTLMYTIDPIMCKHCALQRFFIGLYLRGTANDIFTGMMKYHCVL